MRTSRISVVAMLILGVGGCELTYEPEIGELPFEAEAVDDGGVGEGGGGGRCQDSDPSTEISFSTDIRPLCGRSPGGCGGCHTTNTTSGFNLSSYEALRRGGINSGTRIILPDSPCDSILLGKVGLAPAFGARMPYNGPPYYSREELTLIRDWIIEGARNN